MTRYLWPGFLLLTGAAFAQTGQPVPPDPIEVTATRTGASIDDVPASVTVLRGDELRARGAKDLRAALAGVAGVEISMGGDHGPGGAVPAFWGLRELDAFLLVVDGVPAGGAFAPALTTLDLTNVERIEVMRGSAPVMYGAASFVGVIHVIHYAAGASEQRAWAGIGSHGSVNAGGALALGDRGRWQQSLGVSADLRKLADESAEVGKGHVLYRAGGALGAGRATFDAGLAVVRQQPDSPVVREGAALTTKTPLDANHNPGDGKLDETRVQLSGGYVRETGLGQWSSLASLAITRGEVIRGFLEDPDNAGPNAAGYAHEREVADVYLDTHFAGQLGEQVGLVWGADALLGFARQEAAVFEYTVALDGSDRPSTAQASELRQGEGDGEREFLGAYVQADWQPVERLSVLLGLRWNVTHEVREADLARETESFSRMSGMAGASWRFWQGPEGHSNLYADYRDSFKPAAFEFGPEVEAAIPEAGTAHSYEAGVKTQVGDRLEADVAWFYQDFRNVFLSGGADIRQARLRGAEVEARLRVLDDLRFTGSYAYHDARFVDATIDSGADDVSGNRFELAPQRLASFAFLYRPPQGRYYGVSWNSTGERWLDRRNTAPAGGYRTVDAVFGYRQGRVTLALHGFNLTDRRDPAAESGFSEAVAGASAYYRLPARHVEFQLSYAFGS